MRVGDRFKNEKTKVRKSISFTTVKSKTNFIDPKLLIELRENLLSWFQKNKRELPFRINKNAYRIWVSEIMLQQTRVAAMLPIYETFLKRFPDPKALQDASEEEVMKYWKGLGYYSRARNLKKGAGLLVENTKAVFLNVMKRLFRFLE
ncbi:base excision DNA repair protein, HhH-GPD family [Leptospira alexanderi serovar Manhao 3 str. L 60]|uniref:Base excision DNA repair protein, HhH-GPD family n=1 Tax=Leptospira alexanderi serovar Manhao 3 str. L 60 TaxID=1049759 RepID=V6I6G0_9LEPT|nr:base excision DNA repair protein, HhH-GPD family [Leptospira alexanderi serovar Manhao 3 str. L 60]